MTIDEDGDECLVLVTRDRQHTSATLGLLDYAHAVYRGRAASALSYVEDD